MFIALHAASQQLIAANLYRQSELRGACKGVGMASGITHAWVWLNGVMEVD